LLPGALLALVGVALTATVAVGYTAFGGMRASVLTDFVQSVVIVVGLVVAVPLALSEVGGLATLVGRVRGVDPSLLGQAFPLPELAGFVAASAVGIAVAPVEVSRFYSMRDEETVRTAIGLSLVGQAVIAGSVVVLGLTARVLFPELSTPDLAAIVLSQEVLGPVFGTLFVVAVLSAILSTADSVMIVTSGGIAHDFYARILDTDAGERRKLLVSRVTVLAVGTVPVVMALNRELLGGLITFITLLNLSLWGSTLFVPVVLGLHWRRTTTAGAIAGLLSGFVTVVVWYVASEILGVVPKPVASFVADPVFPGLLTSSLATIGVSLLTGPPSRRSTERFFTDEE
jgi:Na+/proline symporter